MKFSSLVLLSVFSASPAWGKEVVRSGGAKKNGASKRGPRASHTVRGNLPQHENRRLSSTSCATEENVCDYGATEDKYFVCTKKVEYPYEAETKCVESQYADTTKNT